MNAEYEKLVEELANQCICTPISDRPCAGLLAGGLCDDLHLDQVSEEEDLEDEK